jgi:hypothetical protein
LRGNTGLEKIQHKEKTQMKRSSWGFCEICRPQFLATTSTWCSTKPRQQTSIEILYVSKSAKNQKKPMMIDSFFIGLSNKKKIRFFGITSAEKTVQNCPKTHN